MLDWMTTIRMLSLLLVEAYYSMCPVWNVGTLARAYQSLKTLDSDVDSGTARHCSTVVGTIILLRIAGTCKEALV